jgi:hypothetical protein
MRRPQKLPQKPNIKQLKFGQDLSHYHYDQNLNKSNKSRDKFLYHLGLLHLSPFCSAHLSSFLKGNLNESLRGSKKLSLRGPQNELLRQPRCESLNGLMKWLTDQFMTPLADPLAVPSQHLGRIMLRNV